MRPLRTGRVGGWPILSDLPLRFDLDNPFYPGCNSEPVSARLRAEGSPVPEGLVTITRQFTGGDGGDTELCPVGRHLTDLSPTSIEAQVQASLRDASRSSRLPGVKTPGYCQVSLRDMAPFHHKRRWNAGATIDWSLRDRQTSQNFAKRTL